MNLYETIGVAVVVLTSTFGTALFFIAGVRYLRQILKSADDNTRIEAAWISRGLREFAIDDEQHRKALVELEWVRRQVENNR